MSTCKDCLHVENCEIAKMTYGHYADDYDCDLYECQTVIEHENLNYIREKLSDKARLLQLGEECAELSAAIFKLLRKTETDNPTPKSLDEVRENLIEEIEDVGGNPVEKHYDKFCQKYHGRKIVLTDAFKDRCGKYRNDVIYEIILERENDG